MSWILTLTILGCTDKEPGEPVRVAFEAYAETLVGEPFGLNQTDHYGVEAAGWFEYDASENDDAYGDEDVGEYRHSNNGAFELTIEGVVIEGSGSPLVEIQGYGPDSFIYQDGPGSWGDQAGIMTVNGQADEDLDLFIIITDTDGSAFEADELPAEFPLADPELAHTFSLKGQSDDIFFEFTALTQVE